MSEISTEKLAEIEALAKKATPGPWQHYSGDVYDTRCDGAPGTPLVRADREYRRWGRDLTNEERDSNAAYIAACDPQTVLALLASHAALAAEVERLKQANLDNAYSAYVATEQLTTARESAAREMRERCAAVVNEARGTSYDLRGIAAAINALPLTPTKEPADG